MRVSKFHIYLALFIPIFIFSNGICNKFGSEISGIIFFMNIIAIPCCIIYQRVTKNNNFIIYSLFFFSLCIDNLYVYYNIVESNINYARVPLMLISRSIFIILIIFDCNMVIDWIAKNKAANFAVFIVLNSLFIITNNVSVDILYKNKIADYIIGIGIIVVILALIITIIKDNKKKEFMEIVFLLSIVVLVVRRAVFHFTYIVGMTLIDEKILSCLGFYILILGLFVESSCLSRENNILEKEVKVISEDIKEFQEIEKLRSQFFANISHEIKTPINIIFSGVQLIESKIQLEDKIIADFCKKYLPMIKQNCFRILRLTNNLIDMTKLDSGFMKMNFKNVDIVNLVEDITMSVVEYVKDKEINIIFDTLVEEKVIKCDVDGMERIILNLISNSIKFTPKGGNILVSIETEDGYVVIKVKDDGSGIPKENRESVFNVFVQGDKNLNRRREGSGIGLALVKGIVEQHHGEVRILDTEIGTEVEIKLPDVIDDKLYENIDHSINDEKDMKSKINTEFSDIYD